MIRKGWVDDLPAIMNIIYNAITKMEEKGIYQWDSIYLNAEIIIEDLNDETLYLFEDDNIIKGIIVFNEYQNEEYKSMPWEINWGKQLVIHRLCIEPQYEGHGIARLLMDYAERFGEELGYSSIRLDAFANNQRACDFYVRLGYKIVGSVEFRKGKFYCFEKKLG